MPNDMQLNGALRFTLGKLARDDAIKKKLVTKN
jgi:hypothetical protein